MMDSTLLEILPERVVEMDQVWLEFGQALLLSVLVRVAPRQPKKKHSITSSVQFCNNIVWATLVSV